MFLFSAFTTSRARAPCVPHESKGGRFRGICVPDEPKWAGSDVSVYLMSPRGQVPTYLCTWWAQGGRFRSICVPDGPKGAGSKVSVYLMSPRGQVPKSLPWSTVTLLQLSVDRMQDADSMQYTYNIMQSDWSSYFFNVVLQNLTYYKSLQLINEYVFQIFNK